MLDQSERRLSGCSLVALQNATEKRIVANRGQREIALILARCTYTPDVIEHIPGVSNSVADTLSRKSELGEKFRLPPILDTAVETYPQQRNQGWWLTRRADAKSAGGVA